MSILKYSYHHLSPSLKSCFSYCALFPKDFEISKMKLSWLWMAHGCLDVTNDGRSIESVGDDYFMILLNRCFFQDIEQGAYGAIHFCKMHDLIHDLALDVAGKESLALETSTFQFDQKIRHLSIGNDGCKLLSSPGSCLGEAKNLRTLCHNFSQNLYSTANESNVKTVCSKLRHLRVLDLSFFWLASLPNSLGKLSHLRYLDLSLNDHLEVLPESIIQLQNLIVLNLTSSGVRELPTGLKNLRNLRHLGISDCTRLTHMPVGIDSMVGLQTLSLFVAAGITSKQVKTSQLIDLRHLVHLKARLEIVFRNGFSCNLANAMEVDGLLSNKVHLKKLVIRWEGDASNEHSQAAIHETLLEGLRPHCNIQGIEIRGFKGVKLSSWVGSLAVFFPSLVEVSLHGFDCLFSLPLLSQLIHLKVLRLTSMPKVEFIECDREDASSDSTSIPSDGLNFFPSLQELRLRYLPKLKGVTTEVVQSFPRLHKLEIEDCLSLTAFPRCPCLKTLRLIRVHEDFHFRIIINDDETPSDSAIYLEDLDIDKVGPVNLLFSESLKGIYTLRINGYRQEMLSESAELFRRHASSIRYLRLSHCKTLESLCGGGIEHLINLTYLSIVNSTDLDLQGEGNDCGMSSPWRSLKNLSRLDLPQGFRHLTSLRSLQIYNCSLETLPEWLSSLTSLSMLWLQTCAKLTSLPEAITHMPALTELRVWNCKHLTHRCTKTDGLDWPKN